MREKVNERSFLDIKLHILNLSDSLIKNKVFGFVLFFFWKKKKVSLDYMQKVEHKDTWPCKSGFLFQKLLEPLYS